MEQVALVTGATRGIGKAVALALARDGFKVVVAGRTMRPGEGVLGTAKGDLALPGSVAETVAAIEAAGGEALGVRLDLIDRASIDAAIATTIERFGRLDVLVNNAVYQGHGWLSPIADFSIEDAERNFLGSTINQLHLSREAIARMVPQGGGRIVFVTSLASVWPASPYWGLLYAAAKAAFNKIPDFIDLEYRDAGVKAFLVEPGFTITEAMVAEHGADAAASGGGSPPRRPEETADAVAWLARHPDAVQFSGGTMIHAPDFLKDNAINPAS